MRDSIEFLRKGIVLSGQETSSVCDDYFWLHLRNYIKRFTVGRHSGTGTSHSYSVFSSSESITVTAVSKVKQSTREPGRCGGLYAGSMLKPESRTSLCNCNWNIREAFLLNSETVWYNLKRGEIKLYIAFCSFSFYLLEILFTNTPGITLLAAQPAWSMTRAWQAGHGVLANTASPGKATWPPSMPGLPTQA